jgi:hypothetical protein
MGKIPEIKNSSNASPKAPGHRDVVNSCEWRRYFYGGSASTKFSKVASNTPPKRAPGKVPHRYQAGIAGDLRLHVMEVCKRESEQSHARRIVEASNGSSTKGTATDGQLFAM